MFHRAISVISKSAYTTRRGFGWTKKNIRVEELSGLRESTYRDYALTPKELIYHTVLLFIPITALFYVVCADQKEFYSKIGGAWLNFGLLGPMTNAKSPVSVAMAAAADEEEE